MLKDNSKTLTLYEGASSKQQEEIFRKEPHDEVM